MRQSLDQSNHLGRDANVKDIQIFYETVIINVRLVDRMSLVDICIEKVLQMSNALQDIHDITFVQNIFLFEKEKKKKSYLGC